MSCELCQPLLTPALLSPQGSRRGLLGRFRQRLRPRQVPSLNPVLLRREPNPARVRGIHRASCLRGLLRPEGRGRGVGVPGTGINPGGGEVLGGGDEEQGRSEEHPRGQGCGDGGLWALRLHRDERHGERLGDAAPQEAE